MLRGPGILRLLSKHRSIRFSSYNRGGFVSQLPKGTAVSPFADPDRVQANNTNLLKDSRSAFIDKRTNEPPIKPIFTETQVSHEAKANTAHSPTNATKPTILAEKPAVSAAVEEKKPKTDVEELTTALKSSIEQMEMAISSGGGAGSLSDDESERQRQEEAEKRRKRMEKNTKLGGFIILGIAVCGSIAFAFHYGRAKRDAAGNIIPDAHSGSILAPFYRIYDSIWEWRDFVVEPAREQLLPDPLPAPYLQPKYTVVIEMKNVLVNPQWTYKTGYRFAKRPALDYFLDVIGYPNFEVVIYTSESAMTAMPVIDSIDPKQRIMFRLFRDCTKYKKGQHMKDLSKLNRDLSKVIYIDFDAKAGSLNPENMLRVPEWKGNADDTSLVDLAELLKTIHLSDVDDVRPTIQYYSQFDDPAKEFRRRAIYLAEQEATTQEVTQDQSLLKRYSGKLFGFRRHQST